MSRRRCKQSLISARFFDTVEVVGSNPTVPKNIKKGLQALLLVSPFSVICG